MKKPAVCVDGRLRLVKKPSCKEFRRPHCARRLVSERNRRKAAALSAEMASESILILLEKVAMTLFRKF